MAQPPLAGIVPHHVSGTDGAAGELLLLSLHPGQWGSLGFKKIPVFWWRLRKKPSPLGWQAYFSHICLRVGMRLLHSPVRQAPMLQPPRCSARPCPLQPACMCRPTGILVHVLLPPLW